MLAQDWKDQETVMSLKPREETVSRNGQSCPVLSGVKSDEAEENPMDRQRA